MLQHPAVIVTLLIALLSIAGVIIRPWKTAEMPWAVGGAVLLVAAGLLPWRDAARAVGQGADVYMFLTGMMLLSELARREGLFDRLAAQATAAARGSPRRMFFLVYAAGTVVTLFMSNDATAVVMTPAVLAVAKTAEMPLLPLALICAFIANAASFGLPIANPANLVLFGNHVPPLGDWLAHFALPSLLSIFVTLALLCWTQRGALRGSCRHDGNDIPPLSRGGKVAAAGITATAITLLASSAAGLSLGLPTLIAALVTACAVVALGRTKPATILRDIHWAILPLVAGLFVIVAALARIGVVRWLAGIAQAGMTHAPAATAWGAGIGVAFVSNLMNNLPAGLLTSEIVQADHLPRRAIDMLLVGVDLGPNLSVTGSLATILWLAALRREGVEIGAWQFLRLGALLMPAALLAALAGVALMTPS